MKDIRNNYKPGIGIFNAFENLEVLNEDWFRQYQWENIDFDFSMEYGMNIWMSKSLAICGLAKD